MTILYPKIEMIHKCQGQAFPVFCYWYEMKIEALCVWTLDSRVVLGGVPLFVRGLGGDLWVCGPAAQAMSEGSVTRIAMFHC